MNSFTLMTTGILRILISLGVFAASDANNSSSNGGGTNSGGGASGQTADPNKLTGNQKLYYERTGKIPTGEVHHGLPREYKEYFNRAGLDIDDYLYDIPKEQHRLISEQGIHTNSNPLGRTWNAEWKNFFNINQGGTVTQEMILKQLKYMADKTGIEKCTP